MRNKLICYVESIFEGLPDSPQLSQLREEILQNTLDRYDEECAKGVSETVAYNVAVRLSPLLWRCTFCVWCRCSCAAPWAGRMCWDFA